MFKRVFFQNKQIDFFGKLLIEFFLPNKQNSAAKLLFSTFVF